MKNTNINAFVTKYISIFEEDTNYGKWCFDNKHKGTADDPKQMPFVSFRWNVLSFIEDFYKYDLGDKNYTSNYENIPSNKEIKDYDINECITVLTQIIRFERFCDGWLLSKLEDGTIIEVLKRLKELTNV